MTPQITHVELTDTLGEELALFAFGLLESEQATHMARHLETGCAVCNNEFRSLTSVMAGLASSIHPVDPSPDLKQRLLAGIRSKEQVKEQPEPGMYIVRSGSGKWRQSPWKGISYQRLYYDPATGFATSLLRIDPGAQYPAHRHKGAEQSWIVQGSCRIGSVTLHAGDFACAAAGTEHGVLESDDGCVLLIVSSAKDEVLA